ncbi:Vps62-related protein [Streptomyces sp. NPDC048479]|uniref:Vps62-related protein n=1 Tax=Streptomyces sp. NPDC048479 TaxID=3154725 RepID=UPI00344AA684
MSVRTIGSFTKIYDDSGTGADDDVAVWRPDLGNMPGYHSLGDVAMNVHDRAPANAFVVKGPKDALEPPTDYQLIWSDHGSGGDQDGSLWQPIAPPGYTCLGGVAAHGYSKPSTDVVRCIKTVYTAPGTPRKVWDDEGSGAEMDVSIWEAAPIDAHGLIVSGFVARTSHEQPGNAGLYRVLNKTMTDIPAFSATPVTPKTARAMAPRIWLDSDEQYFPADVEDFLPHVREEDGYLVTKQPLGCDSCTDPRFLYGQRPYERDVPAYAQILNRTQDGAPTTITDIFYWMFYPYNQGKEVCVGWDSPAGCIGGTKRFGNHVGDWGHAAIRFVDNLPHQLFLSSHSGGTQYFYGDKNVELHNWQPVAYAGRGSHELYATPGRHVYHELPQGGDLADDTDQGMMWDTAAALVPYQWQPLGSYKGSLSWLNITSRWGNPESGCLPIIDQCVLEDGPTALMKRDYAQPPLTPLE